MTKSIKMYEVEKGGNGWVEVMVEKKRTTVIKTDYRTGKTHELKIKGAYRRFYSTRIEADKAVKHGW